MDTAPLHPPHPQTAVHADGHPVGEHLLDHGLCAPQHELRVLGGRGVDEVYQQLFHDARVVLELAMERDGQQGGQTAPVCGRGASALAIPHGPGIWRPHGGGSGATSSLVSLCGWIPGPGRGGMGVVVSGPPGPRA